jgi:O-antigen/teichoic acid export membrane protein
MMSLGTVRTWLFAHRHWEQIVAKNIAWATSTEVVVRLLKLALLPLVARVVGPLEFGRFALAFSFASMFAIVFDAGLATTTTRELAIAERNAAVLPDIVLIKLALGVLGIAAMLAGMPLVTRDPAVRTMIVVLGVAFFILELVNLAVAVFRARQRMEYEFLVRFAQAVFLVGAVALAMWRAASVVALAYAYLISGVLTLGLVCLLPGGTNLSVRFRLRPVVWRRVLAIALPLALAGTVTTAYMNLDSVLLGAFGRIADTGWYNLASRIAAILLVPTGLLSLVVLPAFASTARNVDEAFRRRWENWSMGMIVLGAYLACLVFALSDPLVRLVFGAAFAPTGAALRILGITVALIFVYTPSFQALIVFDRQRALFGGLVAGGIVNVALNVALIPAYGLYGAAWATVATHAVLLAVLFVLAARCTPVRPVTRPVAWAAGAAGVAGGLAYALMIATRARVWVAVPLGSLVFAGVVALLFRTKTAAAPQGMLSP